MAEAFISEQFVDHFAEHSTESLNENSALGENLPFHEGSNDTSNEQEKEDAAQSPTTGEVTTYILKCVFCGEILTSKDEPKILECLHSACGPCIHQKLADIQDLGAEHKELQCTTCGFYMDPKNIIENQFLTSDSANEDVSSKLKETLCSSCSDEAIASSWCVECAEFICDNCVQAHQRLKITKDHTIKDKDEGIHESQGNNLGGTVALFCSVHPHERLSLFCENCDKLTCRDCQLTEHRDHKYKFTHEIAADCRSFINGMLTDISYKRVLLNSAMKVIDDRQGLINDKKQVLVQQIANLVVKLTNTITARGKQLVTRLNEVCDSKHKTLHEKKIALDHLSKITDHCIQFTRSVLENPNDTALLYSKRHLQSHLQRIKSRRADIPNPEIPVRIELALDKVSDLLKVISSIGQIIVDGRVYPAQTSSPNAHVVPPQSSPNANQSQCMYLPQPGVRMEPHPNVPAMYYQNKQSPMMQQQQQQQQQQMQKPPNPLQNLSLSVQNITPPMSGQCLQTPRMGSMVMQRPSQMPPQHSQQSQHMRMPMQMMRGSMSGVNHRQPTPSGMNSQQQVTSSTHPQANLRGLLQPNQVNPVYIQTGPSQYQAIQRGCMRQQQPATMTPHYHALNNRPPQQQQQPPGSISNQTNQRYPTAHPNAIYQRYPMMRGGPTIPMGSGNNWHIPQAQGNAHEGGILPRMPSLGNNYTNNNNNFKIMLKPQQQQQQNPSGVSSTIPKSPGPNETPNDSTAGQAEKSLDKFCEESVKDLMATIAKLDSNGVQVLAENRAKTGGSPHVVDSSTGDVVKVKSELMDKDDPNEDWCAVCMDGGELVCCDKCPKVFHQFCHIPNLTVEESDIWQCLLCMNFADIPDNGNATDNELSSRQRKVAERIILELYCQYELSLPFRELVGQENVTYYEVIKKPVALDTIRQKLDWNSEERYRSTEQLVKDVRQMFRNAYYFNAVESQVYSDAKSLEKFFDEQLEKWLPEYAYEMFDEEETVQPPSKKFKRIINDDDFE